ncbi:MAG: GntT/GntP/DsdX family permease, partial [Candidatus Limnocylindrales bacterium]
ISALAGLSVLHGLVPPHPGPLIAIAALKADLGLTLVYGLIVAIPTVIIAGPLFGAFISRYVHAVAPATLVAAYGVPGEKAPPPQVRHQPAFATAVAVMLLPIVLMLLRAFGELFLPSDSNLRSAFDVAGTPLVALLAGVLLAMYALGVRSGMNRGQLSESIGAALPPIAGILLIVAAGGGFKQVLVDAGVGDMVGRAAQGASLSPLVLGWLVAVGIRVATGSATVATITAAGIVAPLAATLTPSGASLLALAIGSGSLFFSHVNDAGFWLVKEYFGLTVGETLKSWSVMETIISVVGLGGVLLLNVFVGG